MLRLTTLLALALSSCELAAPGAKAKDGDACSAPDDCASGRCSGGFCAGPDCTCEQGAFEGCGMEPRTVKGCRTGWKCVGTPVTLWASGVCRKPCSEGCPTSWTCRDDFCVYKAPAPVPPSVTISSAPEELELGATATFSGAATAGDSPVQGFSWSLGDGTRKDGTTVTHVYSSVGRLTVQAIAVDEAGVEGKASQLVRVCLPLMSECYPFDQTGNCCTGKRCRPLGDAGTRCQDP